MRWLGPRRWGHIANTANHLIECHTSEVHKFVNYVAAVDVQPLT